MPAVNAIDSGTLNRINNNPAKESTDVAGELSNNFMTLLVAQLKNQDPLSPMENAELTSQLAQINTVGGIDKLDKTMQRINGEIAAGNSVQAAGLIGKAVMVPGTRVLLGNEGAATPFGMELEAPANTVTARVVDASGQILRTYNLGASGAGVKTFSWDGEMDNGERVVPGAYGINIEAKDAAGELVQATPLNYAVVNGVVAERGGSTRLDLGGVTEGVSLTEVRQIL